jgi:hypothetical protein
MTFREYDIKTVQICGKMANYEKSMDSRAHWVHEGHHIETLDAANIFKCPGVLCDGELLSDRHFLMAAISPCRSHLSENP